MKKYIFYFIILFSTLGSTILPKPLKAVLLYDKSKPFYMYKEKIEEDLHSHKVFERNGIKCKLADKYPLEDSPKGGMVFSVYGCKDKKGLFTEPVNITHVYLLTDDILYKYIEFKPGDVIFFPRIGIYDNLPLFGIIF